MCAPAVLAAAAAFQALGQISSAQAQASELKANAQIDEMNAKSQEVAAQDAAQRGAIEASRQKQMQQQQSALFRAEGGGSGFSINSGTALDVLVQNAGFGELDALTIINNADREAYGYKVNASGLRASAQNKRASAKSVVRNSYFQAAGTALAGAGSSAKAASESGSWWRM